MIFYFLSASMERALFLLNDHWNYMFYSPSKLTVHSAEASLPWQLLIFEILQSSIFRFLSFYFSLQIEIFIYDGLPKKVSSSIHSSL
mmetsp:Transcript_3974/g.6114  ORF Transcript_3974/g.6114 Transcript_3974/m.6114 type:complete len:87 (-) Transcript_3974:643-903(-)